MSNIFLKGKMLYMTGFESLCIKPGRMDFFPPNNTNFLIIMGEQSIFGSTAIIRNNNRWKKNYSLSCDYFITTHSFVLESSRRILKEKIRV